MLPAVRNPSTRLRDLRCHSLLSRNGEANAHLRLASAPFPVIRLCSGRRRRLLFSTRPSTRLPFSCKPHFHRTRFAGADRSVSHDAREMAVRSSTAVTHRHSFGPHFRAVLLVCVCAAERRPPHLLRICSVQLPRPILTFLLVGWEVQTVTELSSASAVVSPRSPLWLPRVNLPSQRSARTSVADDRRKIPTGGGLECGCPGSQ
jgi:hypothetical protein